MAENIISDQVWTELIKRRGGGAIDFSPPIAGQMMQEYQQDIAKANWMMKITQTDNASLENRKHDELTRA